MRGYAGEKERAVRIFLRVQRIPGVQVYEEYQVEEEQTVERQPAGRSGKQLHLNVPQMKATAVPYL